MPDSSIFELADTFGVKSPFGDWLPTVPVKSIKIDFVSVSYRENDYVYIISLRITATGLIGKIADIKLDQFPKKYQSPNRQGWKKTNNPFPKEDIIKLNTNTKDFHLEIHGTFLDKYILDKKGLPTQFKVNIEVDGLAAFTTPFTFSNIIKQQNKNVITEFNEDDETRYISKVFHKIRHARIEKREVNLSMSYYFYKTYNFDLNGSTLERVFLQIKNHNYTHIDVSKYEDENVYNQISGISSVGINFDKKLSLYFENEDDKQTAVNYINGEGEDDFIPAFSYLNESKINAEIIERQRDPGLINQDNTPLCGIACIGNLIAKYFPSDYRLLVKDLFHYAEAFFQRGKDLYRIKPRYSSKLNYHRNPNQSDPEDQLHPQWFPQADFVLLTSIKDSENKIYSYDGALDFGVISFLSFSSISLADFGGISFSIDLMTLLKNMIKANDSEDKTSFSRSFINEMEYLSDMDNDYLNGYECLMLINANLLSDDINGKSIPSHWVNYKGKLTHNTANQTVTFKMFTWGRGNNFPPYTMKIEVFKKHFYGYIKTKIV